MRHILIIDDDRSILEGLSFMLLRNMHDIDAVCSETAEDAWEQLRFGAFDLILTDVMMPRMNGLELMQKMSCAGINTPVIIISGYDNFRFVQQAVRLGARDYLLKPVDIHELVAAASRALEETQSAAAPAGPRPAAQEALTALLREGDSRISRENIADALEADASVPIIPVLAIGPKQQGSALSDALCAQLSKAAGRALCVFCEGKVLAIVFSAQERAVQSALQGFSSAYPVGTVRFRVGARIQARELPSEISRLEAEIAAQYFDIALPPYESAAEAMNEMTRAVMQLDASRACVSLDRFLGALLAQNATREYIVRAFTGWFYTLVGEWPEMIRVASRLNLTEYDLQAAVRQAASLSALRSAVQAIIRRYVDELSRTTDRQTIQIEQVKQYVKENLSGAVQIADAAAVVRMHPNYLSAFFKKNTGMSFREYLRAERIAKAKKLILETNMKLYEIGDAVGYPDPAHFSRAFKQVTGVAPQKLMMHHE